MRLLSLVLALTMLGVTPNMSFAGPRASIVATVNSDMISARDLEKNLNLAIIAKKVDIKKLSQSEQENLRKSVLQDLIKESILVQEAKKQGIKVSEKEIDAEIQASVQKAGITKEKFFADLASKGYDEAFYREKIRNTILTQQLINRNVFRKIIVSNQEILDYYLSHGGTTVGKAKVALIVYKDSADMDKYAVDLHNNGKDFTSIAKKVSVGPYAEEGGVFSEMAIADLASPIQTAIAGLKKDEVSKVFDLNGQYAQVKVLEISDSSDNLSEVIDPNLVRQIQDGLRMQKAGNKVEEYVQTLEKKAVVNIR